MNLPTPSPMQYSEIREDIKKGALKIPQFQREFVWSREDSAKLIDSLLKGYPIGSFILWKTNENLRTVKNIGNIDLPNLNKNEYINYILDGQQRITSLFAAFENAIIERKDKKTEDFSKIYIDLNADLTDEKVVITDVKDMEQKSIIKLNDLLHGELGLLFSYDKKYHKKLTEYKSRIEGYNYSKITVDANIEEATEIFTRLNIGGKELSVFEIMVAKTYDQEREFDLSQKYDELIEKLRDIKYETIPDSILLQTISIFIIKECNKKAILSLNKDDIIKVCNDVIKSIISACEYFRLVYRIPVSRLLPYDALIIPFAYFFYKNNDYKPLGNVQLMMQDYFWRSILTERFSSSVESKMAQDIKKIDQILNNEQPKYENYIDISKKYFHTNGNFRAGASLIKGILCLYAYEQPKSFIDDSLVNVANDGLKQANSRNYHHFFPKAYLKRGGYTEEQSNHIANITIVDDFLNKIKLRDKAPEEYMKECMQSNANIKMTMLTHLIDIDQFGIWEDDYNKFIDARIDKIILKLREKLILTENDIQN